jgi:hypothetical protein
MSSGNILVYLAFWSLVGAILFSVFVLFVFRADLVYLSRKENGTLKDRIPIRGYLLMLAFLLVVIGFLVTANYFGIFRKPFEISFMGLFGLNLMLYLILFIYDTAFIDGFVLGYWRPGFLNLSDEMSGQSMGEHIIKSIPVGLVFGLLLSGVSTLISYFAFGRN